MNEGVNDEELNKMIAELQDGQPAAPVVTNNAGTPVVMPPADAAATTPPSGASMTPAAPAVNAASVVTPDSSAPQGSATPLPPAPPASTPASNPELASIKHEVLSELRPLVDKLNLPPEDKFDTLLLLIRSTDDSSLVPAAHTAAKQIADESRRAQALLDIIKEIDFFGQNSNPAK